MPHVKTAISLEPTLFEQLNLLAHTLHVSRSAVLSEALAEYLERRSNRELVARINDAYADEPDEEERAVLRYARRQQRRIVEEAS